MFRKRKTSSAIFNVTLPTTSHANTTNSRSHDSAAMTAAIMSSVLVILIVVAILLLLWSRKRAIKNGKLQYMQAQQMDILDEAQQMDILDKAQDMDILDVRQMDKVDEDPYSEFVTMEGELYCMLYI
jgi:hypothetical protein